MIGITSHDQSDSCSPTARAEELHPKIKRARFLGPAAVCPAGCCGKLHVGVELCSCSREEISHFGPNKEPLSGVTFRNQLLRHKQISLTVSLTSDLSHLLLQSSWQDFSKKKTSSTRTTSELLQPNTSHEREEVTEEADRWREPDEVKWGKNMKLTFLIKKQLPKMIKKIIQSEAFT